MTKRTALLMVCALIALTPAPGVQAQGIGGRLRQKVQEVAGKDEKKDEASQQRSPFNETVIEITEPVMRGFMNGLDVEITLLLEFGKSLTTYKTPDEYNACQTQVAQTPEFMQVMLQAANMRDGATMEEMQRVAEKMNREMAALVTKACGPDPAEWPDHKRKEKIEDIQKKAAAAARPVRSFSPLQPGGPAAIEDGRYTSWAQDQGLSVQAYLVMKERVEAYCKALGAGAVQPGQAVKFPGTGKDIFWVYTEDEAKAIAPLCDEASKKGRVTITLGEAVAVPTKKLTLEMLEVIVVPSGIKLTR